MWSTDKLPSAKVFSIGSTATLIPYEHYFDGNEVFNITQAGIYILKDSLSENVTFVGIVLISQSTTLHKF